MSFQVKCNFMFDFKLGDNINYNLLILKELYDAYGRSEGQVKKLYLKPIIVINTSIIEALLYDFLLRAKVCTAEGLPNIDEIDLSLVRSDFSNMKKCFYSYIYLAKNYKILKPFSDNIYEILDELRVVRNRVHIQNAKNQEPLKDRLVYTAEIKNLSERCIEAITKTMSRKYPRPHYIHGFVDDFNFPWEEKYA